jgi:hypothetical protein
MRGLIARLLGKSETPLHIQEALDASATATAATNAARRAVSSYWRARRTDAALTIADYEAAELKRLERRAE